MPASSSASEPSMRSSVRGVRQKKYRTSVAATNATTDNPQRPDVAMIVKHRKCNSGILSVCKIKKARDHRPVAVKPEAARRPGLCRLVDQKNSARDGEVSTISTKNLFSSLFIQYTERSPWALCIDATSRHSRHRCSQWHRSQPATCRRFF